MSPQVVVYKLYLEGIPLFRQLYFTSDVMYYLLARKEDNDLKNEFGDEYEIYRQKIPMFLPIRFTGIF